MNVTFKGGPLDGETTCSHELYLIKGKLHIPFYEPCDIGGQPGYRVGSARYNPPDEYGVATWPETESKIPVANE